MTTKQTEVTVKVGEKDFSRTYDQTEKTSITSEDLLSEMQKDIKQFTSDWWYGRDLRMKAVVRAAILAEVAGPDKAFEKSVKDFIKMRAAMGKPVTEEQAKKFMKAMAEMEEAPEAVEA